jgi:hypothetical protein
MPSTAGLRLYSNLTDNKIGEAISIRSPVKGEGTTYYEFMQLVQFKIDSVNEYRTKLVKWRRPKTGYGYWQYKNIQNNNTGLVTVNFEHIMKGVYSQLNDKGVRRVRFGGSIANGQLQPAAGSLAIVVTKNSNGTYQFVVTGTTGQQATHNINLDAITAENANELDFVVT